MNLPPVKGLGLWIVSVRACDGGSPSSIAARCRRSGANWLAVRSGGDDSNGQVTRELVSALAAEGIGVVTWHYSVPGARDVARQIAEVVSMLELGALGAIVDAEIEWEERRPSAGTIALADRRVEAADFAARLRAAAGSSTWLAHAPWWLPRAHPLFPWVEFGQHFDAVLPQVYWTMLPVGQTARWMIDASEADYARLASEHPEAVPLRAPIGAAFHGTPANGVPRGQPCTPGDLAYFLDGCETDPVLPFWSLYSYDAMPPLVWALLEQRQRQRSV